jgi:hypothetical protein
VFVADQPIMITLRRRTNAGTQSGLLALMVCSTMINDQNIPEHGTTLSRSWNSASQP